MGIELRSLENALRVLDALMESTEAVRITELSRRTRLSKTGVFRILATLQGRGYVTQDAMTKRYRLGMRAWELGCASVRDFQLNDIGRPALERLVAEVGETAILGVPDGQDIVIMDRVDAPRAVRIYSRIGARAPMHATSLGKVILAFRDAATWSALPARLERFTERTIVRSDALIAQLRVIRREGVASGIGEWRGEVAGVAAPVFDRTANPIAAVNVSIPTMRVDGKLLSTCARAVHATAAEISQLLGGAPTNFDAGRNGLGSLASRTASMRRRHKGSRTTRGA